MNQLPGYASGDAATNSTWTVPLYLRLPGSAVLQLDVLQILLRAGVAVEPRLRDRQPRRCDGLLLQHGDQLLRGHNGDDRDHRLHPGRRARQDRVRAPGRGGVRGDAGRQVNFTTATVRTDVPSDLSCSSGATCNVGSPTFWSKDELDSISTQALKGSALDER